MRETQGLTVRLLALLLVLASAAAAQDDVRLKDPPKEVSSTLTPTMLHRSSATVSVIIGEDLRTLGIRTFTDGLRIVPGFEVAKISASESSVSVRSYTGPAAASQGILALIDGRQVYNEFFGGVFWEALPVTMDEIKAIEVIRGPGSFLHGPNAMHGLVNIITKSPLDYDEGMTAGHDVFLSAAGGSYGSNVETLTFIKREGKTGFKATVAHDDIDSFEDGRNTKDKTWADLRLRTRLDDGHEFEVAGGVSRSRFDVVFPPIFITSGLQLPTARYDTLAREGFLKGTYQIGSALVLKANWNHFVAEASPTAVYEPFTIVLDTADLDLQYSLEPLPSHRVTLGTGYRYSSFDTEDEDVSDGRHAAHLAWVFVQDEWSLGSQFFVTGGARLDVHSEAGASVAPRLSLVWEFDPPKKDELGNPLPDAAQSLRATAGYGFRNPSLRELWFDMTLQVSPFPKIIGNRDLEPEMMRSFEVGYWGRPTDRLQAECSVYYNLADRLVVFQGDVATNTASRHNVNKQDAYGMEASVEYQLTKELYSFANYAYEIRRDRDSHDRITDGPRHKANAGVRAVHDTGLSGMIWVNFFDTIEFTDKSTGSSLGRVPSYTLVNAKLWYPFRLGKADGRVFLQGFNLLDHVHREHPDGDEYGLIAMAGAELAW